MFTVQVKEERERLEGVLAGGGGGGEAGTGTTPGEGAARPSAGDVEGVGTAGGHISAEAKKKSDTGDVKGDKGDDVDTASSKQPGKNNDAKAAKEKGKEKKVEAATGDQPKRKQRSTVINASTSLETGGKGKDAGKEAKRAQKAGKE